MKWLTFVRLVFASLAWIASMAVTNAGDLSNERPNILFILTDDQGYGDVSAHGNPILKTPNLDKLRENSRRFTEFMVSPTCAPTRSTLMTGRHEFFNGVSHTIFERERLRLDAVTLPQALKRAGYSTGIFGKWHLGDEADYQPNRRGFDESFIHGAGGIGQSFPGSCGDAPGNTYFDPFILHNGVFEKTKGYCTDVFFEQARTWISNQSADSKEPWFCWIATNAPHSPYNARPEDKALYEKLGLPEETESFFGMLHNIDENVGKTISLLRDKQLLENTLVVFMNDNGGTAGVSVFNDHMRGSKNTAWRGGTRAISFWSWPGVVKPGDCSKLASSTDVFRTLTAIAKVELTEQESLQSQGRSLVPLLKDPSAEWADRELVAHIGRWEKGQSPELCKYRNCSIRNSKYSLISPDGSAKPNWQLYDLENDPSQTKNIAASKPEVVQQLSASFEKWWASVQPELVNENAPLAPINPFKELFEKQFGKQ